MKITRYIMVLLAVFSLSLTPVIVFAEDSQQESSTSEQAKKELEARKKAEEKAREAEKKRSEKLGEQEKKKFEKQSEQEKKKAESKKKACENRRENFKKRMEGIKERSEKRKEVFDKIAERVEAFKVEKNLTVENYDLLLADVKSKAEALHDAHEAATTQASDFNCEDGNNIDVTTFTGALHAEIDAFKDYKTSLKKLIKAVKTAAETTQPTNEGESNDN